MTLTIEVHPAWYNSIWAYILYITLIIVFVQITLKHNLKHLKKEERKLKEENEQAKKRQLELERNIALENELELKTMN